MTFEPARVRAVIFDIDGTLADTDDAWAARMHLLLQRMRVRNPAHLARRIIMDIEAPGNALLALLDRLGLDTPLQRTADKLHRWRWRTKTQQFRSVPGVRDMLGQLHPHLHLAICSARNRETVASYLQTSELETVFEAVADALTCKHTKPYPDPLLWCAERMQVPPEACLMVGDTTTDMRAGRAAGMQCIGVLCGFGEPAELRRAGAHALLHSTASLHKVLLKPG